MRRRRHAPPGFPEMGCRAVVRAPRWYRPAPSGLNGAAHRAGARRPAAAVDPGDLGRATGPAKRQPRGGCPGQAAAPSRPVRPGRWPAFHLAPERRDTGTRQPPPDTSGHLFDKADRQKNYKADRRSAAELSLNRSRGAPHFVVIYRRKRLPGQSVASVSGCPPTRSYWLLGSPGDWDAAVTAWGAAQPSSAVLPWMCGQNRWPCGGLRQACGRGCRVAAARRPGTGRRRRPGLRGAFRGGRGGRPGSSRRGAGGR